MPERSNSAVQYSSPDDLFGWAQDLAKFHEIQEEYPELYQHQCWFKEFQALEVRLKTSAWHHDDFPKGGDEYKERLVSLRKYGVVHLTLGICDSTELARLYAFRWLEGEPEKEEVLNNITLLAQASETCDPRDIFPCVATEEFLESLAPTNRKCTNCMKTFEPGATMKRNGCKKHFKCVACSKFEAKFGCNACVPFPVFQRYGRHESIKDVLEGNVPVYES